MQKWKCSVCGYNHEGDAPPEECPLCKAAAEKFEKVQEAAAKGRRWRCTVCNYIHEGEAPPKECPICKAGANKFVEIDSEGKDLPAEQKPAPAAAAAAATQPVKEQRPGFLARMVMKLHLHPIAVHSPQGIIPASVIFLAIAIFLGLGVFEQAAFYNLVVVLITMPLVLLTGYIEWKNRYKGAKTFIFFMKISCSITVTLTLTILVAWRLFEPGVATADSPFRLIYFGIAAVMLAATALAGHLGGKLVFGRTKN